MVSLLHHSLLLFQSSQRFQNSLKNSRLLLNYSPAVVVNDAKTQTGSLPNSRGASQGITFDRFVRACVVIKSLTESFQKFDTVSAEIRVFFEGCSSKFDSTHLISPPLLCLTPFTATSRMGPVELRSIHGSVPFCSLRRLVDLTLLKKVVDVSVFSDYATLFLYEI